MRVLNQTEKQEGMRENELGEGVDNLTSVDSNGKNTRSDEQTQTQVFLLSTYLRTSDSKSKFDALLSIGERKALARNTQGLEKTKSYSYLV